MKELLEWAGYILAGVILTYFTIETIIIVIQFLMN